MEVTIPELAQTLGEMKASFFYISPVPLGQGQVVRSLECIPGVEGQLHQHQLGVAL